MTAAAALLAHQGGWDEALVVAGPVLVIVGLLGLAKRRVDRAAREREQAGDQASAPRRSTSAPSDTSRPTRSS